MNSDPIYTLSPKSPKKIIRRSDMCSNASITKILGINDNNLVILGNEKE